MACEAVTPDNFLLVLDLDPILWLSDRIKAGLSQTELTALRWEEFINKII